MNEAGELLLLISSDADADTDDIAFYFALQSEEISERFSEALQETYLYFVGKSEGWATADHKRGKGSAAVAGSRFR